MTQKLSNCCKANVAVHGDREGTYYNVCTKCKEACDPWKEELDLPKDPLLNLCEKCMKMVNKGHNCKSQEPSEYSGTPKGCKSCRNGCSQCGEQNEHPHFHTCRLKPQEGASCPKREEKFKIGDDVIAVGNYKDEQLGQFADTKTIRKVTDVKDVSHIEGTSGQWIKTTLNNDWIDAAWFEKVEQPSGNSGEVEKCKYCGTKEGIVNVGGWYDCCRCNIDHFIESQKAEEVGKCNWTTIERDICLILQSYSVNNCLIERKITEYLKNIL